MYNFWRILPGIFLEDFSGHFPTKMRRKNPARKSAEMGERQRIAQKGVRAIDARNSQLENYSNAAKTSVRAPGLSANEREHPFV